MAGGEFDPTPRRGCQSTACTARRGGPTPEMLKDIDALVFDIQDAGVRFYTYITTMAYCMEAAAKNSRCFFCARPARSARRGCDRGTDARLAIALRLWAIFPMPVRYAMTMGELAQMFNAENKIGADLHVMAMKNWRRSETYDQTGLAWIPPSPNLRTVNAAFLYPGIEILQAGGVSVGRGTDAPFEIFGAPVDSRRRSGGGVDRAKDSGREFCARAVHADGGRL